MKEDGYSGQCSAVMYRIMVEKFMGSDQIECPAVIGMTVSKCVLTKCGLRIRTGSI